MKKVPILLFAVLLVCALLLSGCDIRVDNDNTSIELSLNSSGFDSIPDEYTATAGDNFSFSVESNPTTGYTWQAYIKDESIVKFISKEFVSDDSEATGSGGIATLTFSALQKGETKLTLEYARDWEGGEIDKSKTITVTVE